MNNIQNDISGASFRSDTSLLVETPKTDKCTNNVSQVAGATLGVLVIVKSLLET